MCARRALVPSSSLPRRRRRATVLRAKNSVALRAPPRSAFGGSLPPSIHPPPPPVGGRQEGRKAVCCLCGCVCPLAISSRRTPNQPSLRLRRGETQGNLIIKIELILIPILGRIATPTREILANFLFYCLLLSTSAETILKKCESCIAIHFALVSRYMILSFGTL